MRVKVDHNTYSALKEVEEEYREVLEGAINYGLSNKTTSFTRVKAGVYKAEREAQVTSHYVYTACEDASERLDSFEKLKKRGRAYIDKPSVRKVTVHLDDHLWRFNLDKISISTKRGRVFISPTFPKIFWEYYNKGWRIASEAGFRLTKGNVVEFFFLRRTLNLTNLKCLSQLISTRAQSLYWLMENRSF
jgi:transposase